MKVKFDTSSFCIVNYADGKYVKGQERLKESLVKNGYKGDFLFFSELDKDLFPSQNESPWGFKPLAIKYAIEKGYKYVLWLDSNMICIRKPQTIFKKIILNGYYISSVFTTFMGEWCSDITLEKLGISRDLSFKIQEVDAGYFGINSSSQVTQDLLNEWCAFAKDGLTFRGIDKSLDWTLGYKNENFIVSKDIRVKGHRHDQTVLSYLVWKYKLSPSYFETKSIHKTVNGKSTYSKGVSLLVEIVRNRDIKKENDDYLKNYNKFGNKKGLSKLVFFIISCLDTIKRQKRYKHILLQRKNETNDLH